MSYKEDPNKMQKLKSNRSNSRSPAGARLPSYPVHDYPLQTPPTREFRNRIVSPEKLDTPEMLLLDSVHNKIKLATSLQKWRQATFQRRQKKRVFQVSLTTANFDVEPRINAVYQSHQKQLLVTSFSMMKHQLALSRRTEVAQYMIDRHILCKYFHIWKIKLLDTVKHHTVEEVKKAEACNVSAIPDMMARLHSLLSRQAELETESERKEKEITDISEVIRDNRSQYSRIEDEIKDATMENQRVMGLKQSIDHDYKDQIATLRMLLSKEINLTQEKIDEGRQRLVQQEKAKKITSNTLNESQEALLGKMNLIKEKLASAQSIAIQIRDQLLRNDEEQTENSRELIGLQGEIAQMRNECNGLANQCNAAQSSNEQSLDKLKDIYAQTAEQFNQVKMRIRQNNEELADQDARLESLNRELELSKQRAKAANKVYVEVLEEDNTY